MSTVTCCHVKPGGSTWSLSSSCLRGGLLLMLLLLATCASPSQANGQGSLDITAFEYKRKFHKQLNLGECSLREVTLDMGNNSYLYEKQRCTAQQPGTVTHEPREVNDSRNVLITSASGIVAYLGLCVGEAASFLGILNSGDCVAVQIASRLTFNEKTMVRAFVGYYRVSMDDLDSTSIDSSYMEGMDVYLKDKFYLKTLSYGTLEIIFVQFRFRSAQESQEAKKLQLETHLMSTYMKTIGEKIGDPKRVTVINLSTATQETYETREFKEKNYDRAIRQVEILEQDIERTRERIGRNDIQPHLHYQLFPFIDDPEKAFRLLHTPVSWEKTSMLEVQLSHAITQAKKTSKKCRKNTSKLCRRVRELRRQLIMLQAEIHRGRSNWAKLPIEEKNQFSTRYNSKVKSYSSLIQRLSKNFSEEAKVKRSQG